MRVRVCCVRVCVRVYVCVATTSLLETNTHSRARSGGPATADHVDIMGNYEMTIDILRLVSNQANKYVTILGAQIVLQSNTSVHGWGGPR